MERGFTLIELIVVISIISLLASIMLGSFQNSKKQALNAQITQQVIEYSKALALYQSDHGGIFPFTYDIPNRGDGQGYPECLGAYTNYECGQGSQMSGVSFDMRGDDTYRTLESSLKTYLPSYPPVGGGAIVVEDNTSIFKGAVYHANAVRTQATIEFWLNGKNSGCPRPANTKTLTTVPQTKTTTCTLVLE